MKCPCCDNINWIIEDEIFCGNCGFILYNYPIKRRLNGDDIYE